MDEDYCAVNGPQGTPTFRGVRIEGTAQRVGVRYRYKRPPSLLQTGFPHPIPSGPQDGAKAFVVTLEVIAAPGIHGFTATGPDAVGASADVKGKLKLELVTGDAATRGEPIVQGQLTFDDFNGGPENPWEPEEARRHRTRMRCYLFTGYRGRGDVGYPVDQRGYCARGPSDAPCTDGLTYLGPKLVNGVPLRQRPIRSMTGIGTLSEQQGAPSMLGTVGLRAPTSILPDDGSGDVGAGGAVNEAVGVGHMLVADEAGAELIGADLRDAVSVWATERSDKAQRRLADELCRRCQAGDLTLVTEFMIEASALRLVPKTEGSRVERFALANEGLACLIGALGSGGDTSVCIAAFEGHHAILALLLLRTTTQVNSPDASGHPPLYWSMVEGHKLCSQRLLKHKHISLVATAAFSPLHYAIREPDYHDLVTLMLDRRADPMVSFRGDTAIDFARAWGAGSASHKQVCFELDRAALARAEEARRASSPPPAAAAAAAGRAVGRAAARAEAATVWATAAVTAAAATAATTAVATAAGSTAAAAVSSAEAAAARAMESLWRTERRRWLLLMARQWLVAPACAR